MQGPAEDRIKTAYRRIAKSRRGAIVLMGMLVALGGCAKAVGSFDTDEGGQTKWDNLWALVQFKKLPSQPQPFAPIKCPEIGIQDGTADDRVYASGDQSNANLRYQFSIVNFARGCQVVNNQYQMKVGIQGRALLGPAGAPGTYDAPVRIAVVNRSDGLATTTKLYRVSATIPAGSSEGPFVLITEPLTVPVTSKFPDQDYVIKVGLDSQGNAAANRPARHHRRHAATTGAD